MRLTSKQTIAVLTALLALALVWIAGEQVQAQRARAQEEENAKEVRRSMLDAKSASALACPPCPRVDPSVDAGAR